MRVSVDFTGDASSAAAATQSMVDAFKKLMASADDTKLSLREVKITSGQVDDSEVELRRLKDDLDEVRLKADETSRSLKNVRTSGGEGGGLTGLGNSLQSLQTVGFAGLLGLGTAASGPVGAAAGGLLAAIPGTLAMVSGAVGTLVLAFHGLSGAIEGSKADFDKLSPSAQQFVETVRSLDPLLKTLTQDAQGGVLPGATNLLGGLFDPANTAALKTAVTEMGDSIGSVMSEFGKAFSSPAFTQGFSQVMQAAAGWLKDDGDAALHFGEGLAKLTLAADPLVTWMSQGIEEGAKLFDNWVTGEQASGKLAAGMKDMETELQLVGKFLESVVVAAFDLSRALEPLGNSILVELTKGFQDLGQWLNQNRTEINDVAQGALQGLVGALHAADEILVPLGRDLFDAMNKTIGFKEAVEVLIAGWSAFEALKIASALAALVSPQMLAVTAAIIATTEIIQHWSAVKTFLEQFSTAVQGIFRGMWTAIKGIADLAVYGLIAEFGLLLKAIAGAVSHIPLIGSGIKTALDDAAGYITQFRTNGMADLTKAGQQMGTAWGQAFDSQVKSAMTAATSNWLSLGTTLGAGLPKFATSASTYTESQLPSIGNNPTASQVSQFAQAMGMDVNTANVFAQLIGVESSYNQTGPGGTTLTSPAGALGLAQLLPGTAAGLGVNPNNAQSNLQGGATYFEQLLKQFGGNIKLAIAGYNAGGDTVAKNYASGGYAKVFAEPNGPNSTVGDYVSEILNNAGFGTLVPSSATSAGISIGNPAFAPKGTGSTKKPAAWQLPAALQLALTEGTPPYPGSSTQTEQTALTNAISYLKGLVGKPAGSKPLFTSEGPTQNYPAAYKLNRPFAVAPPNNPGAKGPYQTPLDPDQEKAFEAWVKKYNVPFDINAKYVDYDMRGYWLNVIAPGGQWSGQSASAAKVAATNASGSTQFHFPDTYKTPYDTTFSDQSKYATSANPFTWVGNNLVDSQTGQLIFGTPAAGAAPKLSGTNLESAAEQLSSLITQKQQLDSPLLTSAATAISGSGKTALTDVANMFGNPKNAGQKTWASSWASIAASWRAVASKVPGLESSTQTAASSAESSSASTALSGLDSAATAIAKFVPSSLGITGKDFIGASQSSLTTATTALRSLKQLMTENPETASLVPPQTVQSTEQALAQLKAKLAPEIKSAQAELNSPWVTPSDVSALEAQLAQYKSAITTGIQNVQTAVTAQKQSFQSAWQALGEAAGQALSDSLSNYIAPAQQQLTQLEAQAQATQDQINLENAQTDLQTAEGTPSTANSTLISSLQSIIGGYNQAQAVGNAQASVLGGGSGGVASAGLLSSLTNALNQANAPDPQAVEQAQQEVADAQLQIQEDGLSQQATAQQNAYQTQISMQEAAVNTMSTNWQTYFQSLGGNITNITVAWANMLTAMGVDPSVVSSIVANAPQTISDATGQTLTASSQTVAVAALTAATVKATVGASNYDLNQSGSKALQLHAAGGIAMRPIFSHVMGEAGAEALIPLDDPRAREMIGGGSHTTEVHLHGDLGGAVQAHLATPGALRVISHGLGQRTTAFTKTHRNQIKPVSNRLTRG